MINKNRRWAQRLIWCFLAASLAFFAMRYYLRITDDFSVAHMTHQMPYNPAWEIEPISPEEREHLLSVFKQPYHYVGKGAQSYAFISEDKQHVIKFFKFKHLKPNWFVRSLPDISLFEEYKTKKSTKKNRLIDSVFNGYKLAYDVHREESGLVYIHLNMSGDLEYTVTLYDKIGRRYELDLDSVVFILQKTVKTTRDEMQETLDKGDVELAKKRIGQIIDLYLLEYSKGIYDRDHGIMHNTGFAGERAIHLDVGKMSSEPQMRKKQYSRADLARVRERFESWMKAYYPQYHATIMAYWNQRMTDAFEEE